MGLNTEVNVQTPGILDPQKFRSFWISAVRRGHAWDFKVGKGGETKPFMSHTTNWVHNIAYIGFASWGNHEMHYRILNGDDILNMNMIYL